MRPDFESSCVEFVHLAPREMTKCPAAQVDVPCVYASHKTCDDEHSARKPVRLHHGKGMGVQAFIRIVEREYDGFFREYRLGLDEAL